MAARTPTNATAAARLAATSRHLSTSPPAVRVNTITVFGAGLMGAGIAQVAAQNGFNVVLCDVNAKAVENGKAIIQKSIARIAKKVHPNSPSDQAAMTASVLDKVSTTTDSVKAVASTDLVVEAIVENLKIKQNLFSLLDKNAPATAIFATNTSSLAVRDIAATCSAERRTRPQMKLVEVAKAPETSEETMESLMDVSKRMKKTAVRCKDTPGFIVNRLLVPYMTEAIKMVERGDASAKDVNIGMKLGAGYPMGPLELADFVGLDTCHHILSGWREKVENGEEKDLTKEMVAEPETLLALVKAGKLGRKTGEGFLKY
ncbi:hypothetical protein FRB96_002483 [Tulasnella sp. 330]|nr:hypothetical protein FRB96_002483 [Tulasnella sp. 330]KAG8875213.1 hypothetical protein FRB97_005326 [Tulasnella sp. 331]KAG8884670.1 hypothetical protein FRB98_002270 [Tulasnella sp. 332]